MTEVVKIVLRFVSPVRATKPPKDVNLIDRHIEAIEGRILQYARRLEDADEEIVKKIKDWKRGLLNVFPRKAYDGIDQIAFPNTWILGALESRAKVLKLSDLPSTAIAQAISVRPSLIGLRSRGKPVTAAEIEHDTVISADKFGKRSALKMFEVVRPPCETEVIYIKLYSPKLKKDQILKLLEYGRLGATRGQGFGEFVAREVK